MKLYFKPGIHCNEFSSAYEDRAIIGGVGGTAPAFSGPGIGLYIPAEIIKQHGGDICAKSEIGVGSVFYFS